MKLESHTGSQNYTSNALRYDIDEEFPFALNIRLRFLFYIEADLM